MTNYVFIAISLDGYIADKNGGIDWLHMVSNPTQEDMGYSTFISQIDAIVMGRNTFETVCSFDVDWPYSQPVFVLSNTLQEVPKDYQDKATIINGTPSEICTKLQDLGCQKTYIDGGRTIQSFLSYNMIHEITLTVIPIMLGGGVRLFSDLHAPIKLELIDTKVYLEQITQLHYKLK